MTRFILAALTAATLGIAGTAMATELSGQSGVTPQTGTVYADTAGPELVPDVPYVPHWSQTPSYFSTWTAEPSFFDHSHGRP